MNRTRLISLCDWPTAPTSYREPPGGGVATSSDTLSALAQLAPTIERRAQTGDLDPDLVYRMSSLLLLIRDYIAPVEPGERERIIRYLQEVTAALR